MGRTGRCIGPPGSGGFTGVEPVCGDYRPSVRRLQRRRTKTPWETARAAQPPAPGAEHRSSFAVTTSGTSNKCIADWGEIVFSLGRLLPP